MIGTPDAAGRGVGALSSTPLRGGRGASTTVVIYDVLTTIYAPRYAGDHAAIQGRRMDMQRVAIEDALELGAVIGRGLVADLLWENTGDRRAAGAGSDATEEVEAVIRRIDAQLGEGVGSRVAHAMRSGMRLQIAQAEERAAADDAYEAQLPGAGCGSSD